MVKKIKSGMPFLLAAAFIAMGVLSIGWVGREYANEISYIKRIESQGYHTTLNPSNLAMIPAGFFLMGGMMLVFGLEQVRDEHT